MRFCRYPQSVRKVAIEKSYSRLKKVTLFSSQPNMSQVQTLAAPQSEKKIFCLFSLFQTQAFAADIVKEF